MIYSLINVLAYQAEKVCLVQRMRRQSLPKLVPTQLLFHNHPLFHVHPSFTITEPLSLPITQPDLLICIHFDQTDCWHESKVFCSQWADMTTYWSMLNWINKNVERGEFAKIYSWSRIQCFQNARICSIYAKNPQSVRFLRQSENLFTPLYKFHNVAVCCSEMLRSFGRSL